MKLYRVTYTVETVVYASDEEEAQQLALDVRSDPTEVADAEVDVVELRTESDLPPYWNQHCRPWGRSAETIAEILGGKDR
jgi:hypothetical protein